jgi:alkylhydroperoxidase/carboxymuconolactone decarboxylase family protein YurZ
MACQPELLLRRLAAGDESSLAAVMTPRPGDGLPEPALDRRTRKLVQLAALLAVGASTTTLQHAVEEASTNGAAVGNLAGVLLASAAAAGTARMVEGAPRLALALGFDVELAGWDGD